MKDGLFQTTEPEVGQIYEHTRHGERYQILYVDDQVVVLRSEDEKRNGENSHRIERRVHFDKQVESGYMEHTPESDLDMIEFSIMEWSEVSYIGDKTEENLHEAGYETNLDIQQADDSELLKVGGLGDKGLKNLRSFAQ
jgi:ERCC4-type nuclease